MRHNDVQQLLYDYVRGEMETGTKLEVRRHLDSCKQCSRNLDEFREFLSAMPQEPSGPDQSMEQVDWDLLHAAIMQRVQRGDRSKTRRWFSPIEGIFSFARIRPGYVLAVGCAVLILAIILLVKTPEPDQESMIPRETVRAPSHQAEDQEIGRYFRKSRALLVGLSNLDPPPDAPLDLSVERKLSRQLIIDGRSLREQNLDPRSSRLIGDLDRIMERVSSTTETVDPPDIHTIRSDIRGQNLLVKLRVAEASYSIIPVTKAREGL